MNLAPGYGEQEASSKSRAYIRPALRAELSHLDLTGRTSISNSGVVASGSFGDIFKSQCSFDGRQITSAVKRLRFYSKEDISTVSYLATLPIMRADYSFRSLRRRYMYGRS